MIIGAEGAHSKVREFLVGTETAKLVQSPIVASVTMAKLPRDAAIAFQKINPRYHVTFHPNGMFTWISGKFLTLVQRGLSSNKTSPRCLRRH